MSHFDLRRFKAIPDLLSIIFFCSLPVFNCLFSYFDLIIYPSAILPSSQNWEKARREWQFWLEGKLMMVQGRRWGSFQKLTFLLPSGLGSNSLKKDSTSIVNTLRWLNLKLMIFDDGFRTGGGVHNFRVNLVPSMCPTFSYRRSPTIDSLSSKRISTRRLALMVARGCGKISRSKPTAFILHYQAKFYHRIFSPTSALVRL